MVFTKTKTLFQKLFILGVLLACLGLLSADVGTNASTEMKDNFIPCCSYCDEHPEAPICQHGCSLSCKVSQ